MSHEPPPLGAVDRVTGQRIAVKVTEQPEPHHPLTIELLDYWTGCKANGDFVMGRELPARAISRLMKHLMVIEPVDGAATFRIRLAGMVLVERYGKNPTGMLTSDIYDSATLETFHGLYEKVLRTKRPVFASFGVIGALNEAIRQGEVPHFPMTAPDLRSTWILGGVFHYNPSTGPLPS